MGKKDWKRFIKKRRCQYSRFFFLTILILCRNVDAPPPTVARATDRIVSRCKEERMFMFALFPGCEPSRGSAFLTRNITKRYVNHLDKATGHNAPTHRAQRGLSFTGQDLDIYLLQRGQPSFPQLSNVFTCFSSPQLEQLEKGLPVNQLATPIWSEAWIFPYLNPQIWLVKN